MAIGLLGGGEASLAAEVCRGFGPQAPRDLAERMGADPLLFAPAPPASAMHLCNIHFHAHAEPKGPGFAIFAGAGAQGGFRCNATPGPMPAEPAVPTLGSGACQGVAPDDTIEVNRVDTTCATGPGKGPGACRAPSCADPRLRVEARVFLLATAPERLAAID